MNKQKIYISEKTEQRRFLNTLRFFKASQFWGNISEIHIILPSMNPTLYHDVTFTFDNI